METCVDGLAFSAAYVHFAKIILMGECNTIQSASTTYRRLE